MSEAAVHITDTHTHQQTHERKVEGVTRYTHHFPSLSHTHSTYQLPSTHDRRESAPRHKRQIRFEQTPLQMRGSDKRWGVCGRSESGRSGCRQSAGERCGGGGRGGGGGSELSARRQFCDHAISTHKQASKQAALRRAAKKKKKGDRSIDGGLYFLVQVLMDLQSSDAMWR